MKPGSILFFGALSAVLIIQNHFEHEHTRRLIRKESGEEMASIDDLNTAINTVITDVSNNGTVANEVLDELKQIQAENPQVDFSAQIQKLQGVASSLENTNATLSAALPSSSTGTSTGTDTSTGTVTSTTGAGTTTSPATPVAGTGTTTSVS